MFFFKTKQIINISRHKAQNQCRLNAGPPSTPLKQRQTHTDPMSRVYWVIIYMLTWYLKEYVNYYFDV